MMADGTCLGQINKMEKILSQADIGSMSKADLIYELKCQIKDLKKILLSDKHKTSKVPGQNVLQEGNDVRWKTCICHSNACTSCEAELEAIESANKWFGKGSSEVKSHIKKTHIYRPGPYGFTGLTTTEEYVRMHGSDHLEKRCPYSHDTQTPISCEFDATLFDVGSTTKYIMRLPKSFSVADIPGHSGSQQACGLVALLFAQKVVHSKPMGSLLRCGEKEYLSPDIESILSPSLRQGVDTYKVNYGNTGQNLNVQDIVLLLSHINVSIVREWSGTSNTIEFIAMKLFHLNLNEIALIIQMEDYNVWSIARRDMHNDLLILDSQPHNVFDSSQNKTIEYGALIAQVSRSFIPIVETLRLLEKYGGDFSQRCTVVLLTV